MEKVDHMHDALKARRGKGLDIIIGVNPHGEAPEVPGEAKPPMGEPQDKEAAADPKHSDLAPPREPKDAATEEADMHDALMGGLSENDKKDLGTRKPRSLYERAQRAQFNKK